MKIGTTIGHYRVLGLLGAGGMGEVYRARDTRLRRDVAIKVLRKDVAIDPDRLARLEREAHLLAALNHPRVGAIYALEEEEGLRFLVLELVEGESLAQKLASGSVPTQHALDVARQIAEAVGAAHEKGIIHRDLKPANVLITPAGQVKVLDFGIAKAIPPVEELTQEGTSTRLTMTGALVGTPAYISPELIQGDPADERSDIWSFGCLLYEVLAGRPPFVGKTLGATAGAILGDEPDLAALPGETPRAVRELLARCLDKDPDRRPLSLREVQGDLERVLERPTAGSGPAARRRPWLSWAAVLAIVVLGITAAGLLRWRSRVNWARTEALPEIERLVATGSGFGPSLEMWEAHELAGQAAEVLGDDPAVEDLWQRVSRPVRFETEPAGARVYARPYPQVDAEWTLLGPTPLEVRLPYGYHRLRVEREGYRAAESLTAPRGRGPFRLALSPAGEVPDEMVVLPAVHHRISLPGLDHLGEPLPSFLMDRYEVTNREYKEFVDAGGYEEKGYWQHPILDDGRLLSWEEAMSSFVDQTGRPGPSTWQVGDYPAGQDDLPVAGVSWYEAAAYAAFADKALPTVFHWSLAATTPSGVEALPLSNLGGTMPRPVSSGEAMNGFGTYDMAGNVREWVLNSTGSDDERYLLGGGWADPDYGFLDAFAQPALDRAPTNGIRLMRHLEKENLEALTRPLHRPFRDFRAERAVSDETFEVLRRQFTYDEKVLDATVHRQSAAADLVRQDVSFTAAYGGERMSAIVLLPRTATPPLQAVVVFPGSGAFNRASPDSLVPVVDFLVKSGRAVVIPSYKSTYERQDELKSDYPAETHTWRDHVVMWVKDFARTVDYLESRNDIDGERIAYYGFSWGATMGTIIPAVEERLRAVVLYNAGLFFQRALPEADQINFVGRVTTPVLMVNGNKDFIFPAETSQRPLFELLGTAPEDKRWAVYPGSHSVPRNDLIRETLAWLDRYLGPVKR